VVCGCASSRIQADAGAATTSLEKPLTDTRLKYPPTQTAYLPPLKDEGPLFYSGRHEFIARVFPLPDWIETTPESLRVVQTRSADGYRIQLYAGRDKTLAKRVEADALNRCGLSVYLNYEAPQYKVRAGNYTDREPAMLECTRLKQIGFSEAWVVRTTIMAQK